MSVFQVMVAWLWPLHGLVMGVTGAIAYWLGLIG